MQFPPRFIINPLAVKKSIWTPDVFEIILGHRNKNYLNSLWIGAVWNLLTVPNLIYMGVLHPLFNFNFIKAVLGLALVPIVFFTALWAGITGQAMAIKMTAAQRCDSIILDSELGKQALEQGCDLEVLDLSLLLAQDGGLLPKGQTIPGFPLNWREQS